MVICDRDAARIRVGWISWEPQNPPARARGRAGLRFAREGNAVGGGPARGGASAELLLRGVQIGGEIGATLPGLSVRAQARCVLGTGGALMPGQPCAARGSRRPRETWGRAKGAGAGGRPSA